MKKVEDEKIDIDHVAKLANLPLSAEEKKLFEKQLEDILSYVSKLDEVNTDNVEPIGHITGMVNVTRKDEPKPSLTQEKALQNAKKVHNGFFEVDQVIDDSGDN